MNRVLMMPSYRYRQSRHCLWRCCDLLLCVEYLCCPDNERDKGFGISTNVFRNVVAALSEVDTIAIVISGQ